MNTVLFNAIFEAAVDGDITTEQRDAMLEILATEGVFSNPIKKFKAKIEEIKNGKPDEYSDISEVKTFVDRNQKTLDEVSEILEKEPKELNKNAVKTLVGSISVMLAGLALGLMFPITGFAAVMIGYIGWIVTSIIQCVRASSDQAVYNDVIKIRSSLKKAMNIKGMTPEYKKKINKLISQIDDIETEFNAGDIKVTKESVSFDEIFSDMMF